MENPYYDDPFFFYKIEDPKGKSIK